MAFENTSIKDVQVRHASPEEAARARETEGFSPFSADQCSWLFGEGCCPLADEADEEAQPGQGHNEQEPHGNLLVKSTESRLDVLFVGDVLSPFAILAIMALAEVREDDFSGGEFAVMFALQPGMRRLVEVTHRLDTDPGGIDLLQEPLSLGLKWFMSAQDQSLRGAEAFEAGARQWVGFFNGRVPDQAFIECILRDAEWMSALSGVEVQRRSDDVAFTLSRVPGTRVWYHHLRGHDGPVPPVLAWYNPADGTFIASAASEAEATRLFGPRGFEAADPMPPTQEWDLPTPRIGGNSQVTRYTWLISEVTEEEAATLAEGFVRQLQNRSTQS